MGVGSDLEIDGEADGKPRRRGNDYADSFRTGGYLTPICAPGRLAKLAIYWLKWLPRAVSDRS
jgi:hypothetical protein